MNRLRKRILGQSAVEAMYAIPVMLLVYLVGAEMWSMTWNAQYAHIKARYDVHETAKHRPCTTGADKITNEISGSAQATGIPAPFYKGRYNTSKGRTMSAKYVIVCR